jgi:hypothetical protein
MITLPSALTATKYPGYFWDINERRLYSIKVGGVLIPLKLTMPGHFNKLTHPAYRVSVEGKTKILSVVYLSKLKLTDSEIQKA